MPTPNLFHSKFPREDFWAIIKTDVNNSKYPGKPPYCGMVIEGVEYNYTTENPACADALRNRRGQTVLLRTSGREADATIEVIEVQGGAAPAPSPAPRAPAPAAAVAPFGARQPATAPRPAAPAAARSVAPQPQRKQPEQAIADAEAFLQKRRLLLNLCARQAAQAVMQFQQEMQPHVDAGAFAVDAMGLMQSWTASLFITADRSGQADALPTDAENDQPPM